MNIVVMSDVFVNKGYENDPAVRYSDKSDAAFFSIGKSVYDKDAENKRRYINYDVKAFGELGARIRKMEVKEGSRLNIIGRLDQESWEDKETSKKRTKTVIILEQVEYGFVSNPNKGGQNDNANGNGGQQGNGNGFAGQNGYGIPGMGAMPPQFAQMPQQGAMPPSYPQQSMQQGQMPQNFTGYENFGQGGNGGNPYFSQG